MESMRNETESHNLMRFFKTEHPHDYGYGDHFLGIRVPQTRQIVRKCKDIKVDDIPILLQSEWHEIRFCGLMIMVDRFEACTKKQVVGQRNAVQMRDHILDLYLQHADRVNNWDLVDMTAPKILGHWLLLPTLRYGQEPSTATAEKIRLMDDLAASANLWEQRMSMVSTWKTSQQGDPSWCIRYAKKHIQHPHDLMQKAVGWMLREMGKRTDMNLLRSFLQVHVHEMHRTTLRYAIELMDAQERRFWMNQ
ncbi:MAG: DNA alkylation repair protein [Paludibacteraceae bacterium]|nr:DNA alkylation repair protein [Paludibacteraceae bacterium]